MSRGIIILLTRLNAVVGVLRGHTDHSKSLLQYFNYQTRQKAVNH